MSGEEEFHQKPPKIAMQSELRQTVTVPAGLVSPFLLDPVRFGGRVARKGLVFQDRYIAYVLAGLLKDRENLLYSRIEAVEDLDVLLRQNNRYIERYYQMKSMEGSSPWSVKSLISKGIFERFYVEYLEFIGSSALSNQGIEFVFVTDGEVGNEVLSLADESSSGAGTSQVFANLCFALLKRQRPSVASLKGAIEQEYLSRAESFLNDTIQDADFQFTDSSIPIAERSAFLTQGGEVGQSLRSFLKLISYHQRAGFKQPQSWDDTRAETMIEEATRARLIEAFDCSATEAAEASDSLRVEIANESTAKSPSLLDYGQLLRWLGLRPRQQLEEKPAPPSPFVLLDDQIAELSRLVSSSRSVMLHGLSRIGKSQLVAAFIDGTASHRNYFWFTFSGADDLRTLCGQLAYWVGKTTGVWQPFDDFEANRLSTRHLFARLAEVSVSGALIVLDEAQKCTQRDLLKDIYDLACRKWSESAVIFISDEILPEVEQAGAEYLAAQGLSAKQAFNFMTLYGIDLSDAPLEFLELTLKIGGHPMMLASLASELPSRPTAENVRQATEELPNASDIASFLDSLSNRTFFRVLRTDAQRNLISRLSLLDSVFDLKAASSVAALSPAIPFTPADWRYLTAQIFERAAAGLFTISTLIRNVAKENAKDVDVNKVRISAAHGLLDWGSNKPREYLAFQTAVFYLCMAERYEEAAATLLIALPALFELPDSHPSLRTLLLSVNNPITHRVIKSPNVRWHLVLSELILIQLAMPNDIERSVFLLKTMKPLLVEPGLRVPIELAKPTLYEMIAAVRLAKCKLEGASLHDFNRFLISSQNAMRSMLEAPERGFLEIASHVYDTSYPVPAWMDMELFLNVVLKLQATVPIEPDVLCHFYCDIGFKRTPSTALEEMFRGHRDAYLAANYADAYVACELGLATHRVERQDQTSEAQDTVRKALAFPGISAETSNRANVLLADTFFLERNYKEASRLYAAITINPEWPDSYANHVRCRAVDSLAEAGEPEQAIQYLIRTLRRHHKESEIGHAALLRAKAIYLLATNDRPSSAVPLLAGIKRIALGGSNERLKWLYTFFSAWLVAQWKELDELTLRSSLTISNCESIGINPDQAGLDAWRNSDPDNLKADLYLATALKLGGRGRRSLALLRKINRSLPPESSFFARLKLIRAEIQDGDPARAASLLLTTVDGTEDPEGHLRAGMHGLFSGGERIPEKKISDFYEQALKVFDGSGHAIILRLSYAAELLKYFSVAQAKFELSRAIKASQEMSRRDLEAEAIWFKLFDRTSHFFTKQHDLVRELWNLCELLRDDSSLEERRTRFPSAVRTVCYGQAPGTYMGLISAEIESVLSAGQSISFDFVRSVCERAATNVGIA